MSTALPPREGLFVSVSQLKTFLRCGRLYELKYVRGEAPAWVPLPLAFGSAFHAGLAQFYGHLKVFGAPASLEEMQAAFRDSWAEFENGPIPIYTTDDDDAAGLQQQVDKGAEMLAAFREHAVADEPPLVHGVEVPFTIALYHPDTGEELDERLTGFMDLVTGPSDGRFTVVEHKSSARRYAADQLRWDFQLTAYQMAARVLELGEVGLRFQIVTKTKKPAVQVEDVRRDEQDEDDLMRVTLAVLKSIDAGAFAPIRSWACTSCPFQHACNRRRR